MSLVEELASFTTNRPSVLAIGVFDGVHLGHQFLIGQAAKRAKERGYLSGVVTFHPHPRAVLSDQFQPRYISSLPERLAAIKALGVDMVIPLTFTRELSELSAADFVALLQKYLQMREMVVGADFALGKGREGNVPMLTAMGEEMGFTVQVVPPLIQNGEVISSTAIRNALSDGDVTKAARQLGRPVSLTGEVITGDQRGRTIGFPTANVAYDAERALPANGVYATKAFLHEDLYEAVTNIGVRPTFSGQQKTIEVFLLDFAEDIYHQELRIELIERLRGEQRFTSVEELKAQIARDIERARIALKK